MPQDAAWRDTLEWSRQDELLSSLIEVTDRWMRRLAIGAGRWDARSLPPPLNIPRPGEEMPERPKPTNDPQEIAAFFNQHFTK